jgi:hypothetical protein
MIQKRIEHTSLRTKHSKNLLLLTNKVKTTKNNANLFILEIETYNIMEDLFHKILLNKNIVW